MSKYTNGGGFKVTARYGEPIPTRKDNEKVVVQSVEAGDRKWLEARITYQDKTTGKWKPSTTAISFTDPTDVKSFIDAIDTGLEDALQRGVFIKPEVKVEDPPEDGEVTVVPVKPRAAAFGADALVPEDAS